MPEAQIPTAGDMDTTHIRVRRERLRAELMRLEDVVSGPSGDAGAFSDRVGRAASSMLATLRDHVAETEADDGLLAQVARDAPWLEGRIAPLRAEHDHLVAEAGALVERCGRAAPQELRDQALELLAGVSRHRQQGTDLLYDAYLVDISAAD